MKNFREVDFVLPKGQKIDSMIIFLFRNMKKKICFFVIVFDSKFKEWYQYAALCKHITEIESKPYGMLSEGIIFLHLKVRLYIANLIKNTPQKFGCEKKLSNFFSQY